MEAASIGDPLLAASVQYILNVALTLPAILYLDKWGRRPLLLIGSFWMTALLVIVGVLEAAYGQPSHAPPTDPLSAISWKLEGHPDVSKAVVVCSYLFVSVFAVTWGPTSWTYPRYDFDELSTLSVLTISTVKFSLHKSEQRPYP